MTFMGNDSVKVWILSENFLDELLDDTAESGDSPHKGINALIQTLKEYGFGWRDEIQIVLCNDKGPNGSVSSEFDEEYQKYLDTKAQRETIFWTEEGAADEPEEQAEEE